MLATVKAWDEEFSADRICLCDIGLSENHLIIAKLATRKMYDEYGNVHYCVDKTLRDRLEAKLLKTILEFKIVR